MKRKSGKKQTGITLVALVVTIVVLLILAGITIMYTMGENSIFKKAQEAKDKTNQAIKNEQEYMNEVENITDKYINGEGTPTDKPIENIKSDWATIEKIAKEIAKDDSITSESEEVKVVVSGKRYTIKVGDIFEVECDGEVKRVRVLGFKHDDLVDQTVYGGTYTKAGITFDFVEFMTGSTWKQMNTNNTNSGGWANTEMRTFLNGTEGKEKLSNKAYIKEVKKKYIGIYNDASSVVTSNDSLWLLSCSEIWSKGRSDDNEATHGAAIAKEGEQYKWYKDKEGEIDPISSNNNFIKKTSEAGEINGWFLRSPRYKSNAGFCIVTSQRN